MSRRPSWITPREWRALQDRADRTGKPVAVRRRTNPSRRPVKGEVWHGLSGDRCRILSVTANRVTVLQLDTGHRVTSEMHDFLASYKPPGGRSNPEREPSRVRQRGTRVTDPASPAERIAALRQIVAQSQYAKIDGKMVDLFSASAILSVYDAISEANQVKFAAMPAPQMAMIAFKVLNKQKNPSRSPRARASRARHSAALHGLGRKIKRASLKAIRRPAAPGNAAQTLHYLESHRARKARRSNPSTARADRPGNDRDFAAKVIRDNLKKRSGKPWSVTVGRGTAWGWLHLDAPNRRRTWKWRLKSPDMRDLPENYEEYDSGQPGGHMGPAERAELVALLGLERLDSYQGISIPGANDYYDEYMDRAQGRAPERVGVPYWDNPARSRRARYGREARRQAPRGVPGLGSRRTERALRAGRAAKAHYHMMSTADRGLFRREQPNPKGPIDWAATKAELAHNMVTRELYYALSDIQKTLANADAMDRAAGNADLGGYYRDEASIYRAELERRKATGGYGPKSNPGRQTLREWSEKYGIDMRQKSGAYWIPDSFTNEATRRELWNLSDVLVSSVRGGTIWLVKRPQRVHVYGSGTSDPYPTERGGRERRNPSRSEEARETRRYIRGKDSLTPRKAYRAGQAGQFDKQGYYLERSWARSEAQDAKISGRRLPRRPTPNPKRRNPSVAPEDVRAYVKSIRNHDKQDYAAAYAFHLLRGEPAPEWPASLSYMAAQAVRMRLAELIRPTPNPKRLKKGQRVSAVVYGQPRAGSVVMHHSDKIVWVLWDGAKQMAWMHRDSLTPITSNSKRQNPAGPRIVYNRLLGGWYVVVGPHQTPLNGRFNSKAEAQAWLSGRRKSNPRAPLAVGERVSVPYTGRSNRLTSERGTITAITEDGISVQVKHGKSYEDHTWRPDQVRRARRQPWDVSKDRTQSLTSKLELQSLRKQKREADAMAKKARADYECAQAKAKEAQPMHPEEDPAPYRRFRAEMTRAKNREDAYNMMSYHLEQQDPKRPDPLAPAAQPNPRGSEMSRARATSEMWHEFPPSSVRKVRGPSRVIPGTLVALGEAVKIDYKSNKYTGRMATYTHSFKRPRPILATDPDAKHLHIVGGKVKITADGLVN